MKFSAPVHVLKQQARALSRKAGIPLHEALDRIATQEGFGSWSLLAAKWSARSRSHSVLRQLRPGELVILAARPGQGKTLLSLELAVEWMTRGHRAAFFTLEFTRLDVARCFIRMDRNLSEVADRFVVDDSDDITADYIIDQLTPAAANLLIVVDYLQLLDQRRDAPALAQQVLRLKQFARQHGCLIICLSQVDRRYDPARQPLPSLADIRLPNPLDLRVFDKACLLSQGRVQVGAVT